MAKDKQKRSRKEIAGIIIFWLIIAICISVLLIVAFSRQLFGDQVGDYLLGKDIPNGFVLLGNFFAEKAGSLLLTVISVCFCLVLYFVITLVIRASFKRGARQKTIRSLLISLTKYLIIVLAICLVLGSWGVNVAGIFAGVGVLTLIIGLGCKTLVNDVVSGFFIVVDNYYEVGDRVTIDGFTGDIESVGLRTTKIKSWDGNIKCINNSLITTVINLSKIQSVAIVKIELSYNEDIRRAESIIYKNLEKIKNNIPEITGNLKYAGVDSFDDCGLVLMFFADCNEFNRVPVQRALLRELWILFEEEGLIVPYQQIVVNPPDPDNRPRATQEDIELSYKLRHPEK